MNKKLQICVIGSSQTDEYTFNKAYEIGKLVADIDAVLITGGGAGVMEAASKGACENGGYVIGILRQDKPEYANQYCHVVIPTGMGHTRNALNILASDIVIGIQGGAGTMSEYAFAWVEDKATIAFTGFGGWSDKIAGTKLDHRDKPEIIGVDNISDLKKQLLRLVKDIRS